jgi:hypothetical protein
MARDRQAESLERLDQTTLFSARVLVDPSDANRSRLRDFLIQVSRQQLED